MPSASESRFARRWFNARLLGGGPQRNPLWFHVGQAFLVTVAPWLPVYFLFWRARRRHAAKLLRAALDKRPAVAAAPVTAPADAVALGGWLGPSGGTSRSGSDASPLWTDAAWHWTDGSRHWADVPDGGARGADMDIKDASEGNTRAATTDAQDKLARLLQ